MSRPKDELNMIGSPEIRLDGNARAVVGNGMDEWFDVLCSMIMMCAGLSSLPVASMSLMQSLLVCLGESERVQERERGLDRLPSCLSFKSSLVHGHSPSSPTGECHASSRGNLDHVHLVVQ